MAQIIMTTHTAWDPHLTFPLPVFPFNSTEIFADYVWGVKIEAVTEDGKTVPGEEYEAELDDVNMGKLDTGSSPFIYLVRADSFYFATGFDESDYALERYAINKAARRIRIDYRMRESQDSLGPLLSLESRLV